MSRAQAVSNLLAAYRPFDDAEKVHRDRMIALAHIADDPFSRAHFDPGHFTASAFILSPDGRSLLLIHHSKLHRWLQPGGHVEPEDSDLITAARREIVEEVGMTSPALAFDGVFDLDIHVIPARKQDPQHEHFDVRFLFRADDLNATAGSDAKDCRWVPIVEVTESLTDASVMRALAKLKRA